MRRAFFQALFIFLLLLVPVLFFWLRLRPADPEPGSPPSLPAISPSRESVETTPAADADRSAPPAEPAAPSPEPGWENALSAAHDDRDRRAGLRAVAVDLQAAETREAVRRIRAYLDSGRDVPTGLPFALGAQGELTTAPTLRVWLLDWLGRIDPIAAARRSQGAFAAGPGASADEWALHLRNHAWGFPDDVSTVLAATRAMLEYRPWRESPTAGFQESFDAFVWANDASVADQLVRLVPENQPRALRVPANLALDRLVLNDPAGVLPRLAENRGALDANPRVRAGYFARADFTAPEQRTLVESYFLDARLTGAERDYFLALMPNFNLSFSYNLLSENPRPTSEANERQRIGVQEMLEGWLDDPRFRPWRSEVEAALQRLEITR